MKGRGIERSLWAVVVSPVRLNEGEPFTIVDHIH